MKKLRYLLCVSMMMVSMLAWSYDFVVDGICYSKIDDKNVCVANGGKDRNGYKDDVIIPSSVTIDGYEYNVTSIGSGAFFGCYGLTSVTIPNSVTTIGDEAFCGCSLESIEVESGNKNYDSRNNCNAIIETATNTLIFGCKNTTIPNSVTSIGDYAFDGCSSLTSVTIPSSVTSIGDCTFDGCTGLTSITIPSSVTSIGDDAFQNCTGLTSITIPSSVTSIGNHAFDGCTSLTSITIPSSVTSIGHEAFCDCSSLTSIVVESENKNYDSRDNCNAIIETATNTLISGCNNSTIPSSVTSIGDCAFDDCTGLTSITIPSSVTSIGRWAFDGCTSLTSIICDVEKPLSIDASIFDEVDKSSCILYVPAGCVDAYKSAEVWNEFENIREIGDVTAIKEASLEECTSDKIYNLRGQKVANDYRGVIIKNGKKEIR